jgi:cobalt-zinc-cadmium efflux system protein
MSIQGKGPRELNHAHNRSNERTSHNKAFGYAVVFNVCYILVEVTFGVRNNSMALIADAGHNLSDVLGLLIAWGGAYLARTPTTDKRTYGLRKATIMGAFLNALILLVAVGAITVEAIRKIIHPEQVGGTTIMIVAGIGVVINGLTALMFVKGRERDINIKGAFLHMAADAGVSLGVVLAGLFINLSGFFLIDPIMSLVIVGVITIGTWGLLKDSFHLSMDAVPNDVSVDELKKHLRSLDGVEEVHDLHVWAMSTTEIALTAHLVMGSEHQIQDDKFLRRVCKELDDRFGIEHSTIQIERAAHNNTCDDENV